MKIFKNIGSNNLDIEKNNIGQVIADKWLKALTVLSIIAIVGALLSGVFFLLLCKSQGLILLFLLIFLFFCFKATKILSA